MNRDILDILVCPNCAAGSPLALAVDEQAGPDILSGRLTCPACRRSFPIVRGIPRFVEDVENYCDNFSYEWNRWGRVQIDRLAGHLLSTRRFLADTRLSEAWFKGKLVLDAGCGAGRFADVAAAMGARVVAVDISAAVDAAQANVAAPIHLVQASLQRLPFRQGTFDGIYCFGVIQHTPDPAAVMSELPRFLKPDGRLAYNFYEIDWRTRFQPVKYALRRITPNLSLAALHRLALMLTILFFPLSWLLSHIRYVRFINVMLPICATHHRELSLRQQFMWTLLDTFDWYSPRYEFRQSHATVADILRRFGLKDVESAPGLAWGRMPATRDNAGIRSCG
jgi:SAM-dependent methyltransferase